MNRGVVYDSDGQALPVGPFNFPIDGAVGIGYDDFNIFNKEQLRSKMNEIGEAIHNALCPIVLIGGAALCLVGFALQGAFGS